jgi:PAS domain S-box-containing protein
VWDDDTVPQRRTVPASPASPSPPPDGPEAAAFLQAILDNSPVGLGLLDTDLRFVQLNDVLATANRLSAARHLGRRIDEVWRDIPAGLLAPLQAMVDGGEPVVDYVTDLPPSAAFPNGRHTVSSYYPVHAGDILIGIGIVVQDRTEQELAELARTESEAALRRSEARKGAVVEASPDGIVTVDAAGRLLDFNAAAERLFGLRAADAVGAPLSVLVNPSPLPAPGEAPPTAIADRRSEVEGRRADGTSFPVELAITPLAGEPGLFSAYLRDLSPVKQAEAALRHLADEQAALRRVATLVASEAEEQTIFDAVAAEAGRLLQAHVCNLVRFDEGEMGLTVAAFSEPGVEPIPRGERLDLRADTTVGRVLRTGEPAFVDSYDGLSGDLAEHLRRIGVRSAMAAPIRLEGRVWGALAAATVRDDDTLSSGSELGLARFADLTAQALANARAREQLRASRTRLVQAADIERRRLERNLHDGAQQRLVALALSLRLAAASLPPEAQRARDLLAAAREELNHALEELRELARGIHPGVLAERGLVAALDALAARSALPLELEVEAERLPEPIEAAIYYVVAESITNAAKHAQATHVRVLVRGEPGRALVTVADDGIGGADARTGSGLRGLGDRVEALGGTLLVTSPPGEGTCVHAEVPVPGTA